MRGYSLPTLGMSSQRIAAISRQLGSHVSPDDWLLYHWGQPIESLDEHDLWLHPNTKFRSLYDGSGEYLSPFVVPQSQVTHTNQDELDAAHELWKKESGFQPGDTFKPDWKPPKKPMPKADILAMHDLYDAAPRGYPGARLDDLVGSPYAALQTQVYVPDQRVLTPYFSKYSHGGTL